MHVYRSILFFINYISFLNVAPKMHQLNKIVVPNVSADWKDVAYALGYDVQTVRCITNTHNGNSTKCCKELFHDWLMTSHGNEPKTWQTLLNALKEVEQLVTVTKQITKELIEMDSNNPSVH